jgi:hypothetical protein
MAVATPSLVATVFENEMCRSELLFGGITEPTLNTPLPGETCGELGSAKVGE